MKTTAKRAREHEPIDPAVDRQYDKLDPDMVAANQAAAERALRHLALIKFTVVPQRKGRPWRPRLEAAIEENIDLLALSEHLGWCAERRAAGWTYGPVRDNQRKQHPALVEWIRLSPLDQEKDRRIVRT